ncbi:MAG: hypothetical protein JXA64_10510, partial [Candidatus Fermentibacteraceae bacterium]|nr:hypothetical protein [Candidatus Fermentibacteraceae bacterium]
CTLVVDIPMKAYTRPDTASVVFAVLSPGDTLDISAITCSGWLGFDPGVAQAGNTGSFRYRWISPDGAFTLRGDTGRLPCVWAPEALVVYVMTFADTPVLLSPDSLSVAVDTLPADGAAALEMIDGGWLMVDPSRGPAGEGSPGWVRSADVSITGDTGSVPRRGISKVP